MGHVRGKGGLGEMVEKEAGSVRELDSGEYGAHAEWIS